MSFPSHPVGKGGLSQHFKWGNLWTAPSPWVGVLFPCLPLSPSFCVNLNRLRIMVYASHINLVPSYWPIWEWRWSTWPVSLSTEFHWTSSIIPYQRRPMTWCDTSAGQPELDCGYHQLCPPTIFFDVKTFSYCHLQRSICLSHISVALPRYPSCPK